jgi:eukaryotic-like serine/threonine-protein kinase
MMTGVFVCGRHNASVSSRVSSVGVWSLFRYEVMKRIKPTIVLDPELESESEEIEEIDDVGPPLSVHLIKDINTSAPPSENINRLDAGVSSTPMIVIHSTSYDASPVSKTEVADSEPPPSEPPPPAPQPDPEQPYPSPNPVPEAGSTQNRLPSAPPPKLSSHPPPPNPAAHPSFFPNYRHPSTVPTPIPVRVSLSSPIPHPAPLPVTPPVPVPRKTQRIPTVPPPAATTVDVNEDQEEQGSRLSLEEMRWPAGDDDSEAESTLRDAQFKTLADETSYKNLGEEQDPAEDLHAPGDVIGNRYELLELLGRGGHGLVFKAYDQSLGGQVAIKFLHPDVAASQEFRTRLKREAQAMAALSGSCVVEVRELLETPDGELFLVMELLHGITLSHYIRNAEKDGYYLRLRDIYDLLHPIVETLEHAHSQGLIHRDLKPANIFVLESQFRGRVRLLDFGLVKVQHAGSITQDGIVVGSPSYMAPETWRGKTDDITHLVDVYSLGAILFRMLAGKVPFEAHTPIEVLIRSSTEPRPSLHEIRGDLPPGVDEWVNHTLAVAPEERYQSVKTMWNVLWQILWPNTLGPWFFNQLGDCFPDIDVHEIPEAQTRMIASKVAHP